VHNVHGHPLSDLPRAMPAPGARVVAAPVIRTLVVDDDLLLAEAHRTFAERVPGFRVVGVVNSGAEALRFLAAHHVDLILLDFFLPDMTGLDVCRAIRAKGHAADVVAITSARDLDIVRAAVSQGVVQYLLKPFTFASFRDKLERYRAAMTASGAATAQHDVDRALATLRGSTDLVLPKGLSEATLATVIDTLRAAAGELSATELSAAVGVSRVTARRYLEHLADQGVVTRSARYGGPGRPEHSYRWTVRRGRAGG